MNTLAVAIGISVAGAVLAVVATAASVWSSHRPLDRTGSRLRADPGLLLAFVGALVLIAGLGDVVYLLLSTD